MKPIPADDLRSNMGTWAVPDNYLPALGHWMHDALPNEPFDPHFMGQALDTYYFDTRKFALRKARLAKDQYCTLRVRRYPGDVYALSAKTESQKFRVEIPQITAEAALRGSCAWDLWLPLDIFARLMGIVDDVDCLQPVVKVSTRRYAIEDDQDRFTLDVHVSTNNGKCLPFNVLEFKSIEAKDPPDFIAGLQLNPIKLSKFLWSTEV